MLSAHFAAVLYVTGVITAAPLLMFVAFKPGLKALFHLEIADEAGRFFTRHWAMLCGVIGGLLVYAGAHPEVRTAIVLAAWVEKAVLVVMIGLNWDRPFTRGMRLTAVFDGACAALYAVWLLLQ